MNRRVLICIIFLELFLMPLQLIAGDVSAEDIPSEIDSRDVKLHSADIPREVRINRALLWHRYQPVDPDYREFLIQQNIDKAQKTSVPLKKLEMGVIRKNVRELFSEGTGTRGGGSGIVRTSLDSKTSVVLLEIHRSQHRAIYPDFYEIDPDLIKTNSQYSPEIAATLIFQKALARLGAVAPNFTQKIRTVASQIPFAHWVPSASELPLLEDHIEFEKDPATRTRVQIAYRRAGQVIYDAKIYESMDGLNRAALWLHEYIYALSSHVTSLQTQRAVSLFFSRAFDDISQDEALLTRTFWELGILNISRTSLRLPPGARLIDQDIKLPEACGVLEKLTADPGTQSAEIIIRSESGTQSVQLDSHETGALLNSMMHAKQFLTGKYPIYMYPAQMTAPDQVCLSTKSGKISSATFSLAYDP